MPTVALANNSQNPNFARVDDIRLSRGGVGKSMTNAQLARLTSMGLQLVVDGQPEFVTSELGKYSLEHDYNAPQTGSVQSQLQEAVDDILLGYGSGRIELQDRQYDFDSIVWPDVDMDKPPAVIEFVGPYRPPTVGFMPGVGLTLAQGADVLPPRRGAILKASQEHGSAFGNIAALSNILPVFKDLTIRVPPNPQWHGVDCGWCTNFAHENLVVDTGRSWGDGSNPLSEGPIIQPTNAGVVGVIMPGEGNGGVSRSRDLLVSGFYNGLRHSEHFDGDRVTLAKNVVAHIPTDGWHSSRIGRESLYWNKYGIQPQNNNASHPITPLYIDELDFEEDPVGGNWYTGVYQINDPSNLLRGRAHFRRMVPASGPSSVLRRRGAAFFNTTPLATPPKSVIDAIGFQGADSATVLPNSLVGQAPTQLHGVWGINGKRAYLATRSNDFLGDLAVWDFGTSQLMLHTRLVVPATAAQMNMGIAFMAIDANNYFAGILQPGVASIQRRDSAQNAGNLTNASGNSGGIAMVAGQELDVKFGLFGKTLRLYVDGALVRSYTLTATEATKFLGATLHGLFAYTQGASGEQGNGRWDFLRAESAGPIVA
jgi:hypothetical protein